MKHIKTLNEYEMINEGNITWKHLLIGLGVVYTLNTIKDEYSSKPMTNSDISLVINNIDSKPTAFESLYIEKVRKVLIDDINSTNKMSESSKIKSINEVNSIKFICVDKETIEKIANGENILGCYFRYIDNKKIIKVIFLDRARFLETNNSLEDNSLDENGISRTILHELRHLVDDVTGSHNNSYSEMNNVVDILDQDIISNSEKGKIKLRENVKNYVIGSVKGQVDFNNKRISKLVEEYIDDILSDIGDEKYVLYITSPAEVYARFHGMKRWMIRHNYIENMNSEIKQEHLIRLIKDPDFLNNTSLDFYNLIFYLKVDLSGKTKSNMDKENSIVANYTDYINRNV
jgi:hypothetical protein